ncbi:MAG: metallopeptidase family protein [Bacillota bacterium]|nr:metallopeptidase family protein [Bacillota bacterium]
MRGDGPGGSGMVDFETFCAWADEIVDQLPERLLEELSGGIQIERKSRRQPGDPPGVYLLGEYVVEPGLGSFIFIYYGSFRRTLDREPPEVWRRELVTTILHELEHHIEALGGVDWLGAEDRRELERLWREVRGEGEAQAGDAGPGRP